MKEQAKKSKKLDIKKLKFLKEFSIKYEVQAGGCSSGGGCSHWS